MKIDVSYKDDAFTPDRAKTNETEFIQSDKVNSLITFGSGPRRRHRRRPERGLRPAPLPELLGRAVP